MGIGRMWWRDAVVFGLALLANGLGVQSVAGREGAYFNKASTAEVLVLSHYCWAQYLPNVPETPEYTISIELCGWGTNHMCSGLLDMNRAKKKWSDRAERGLHLKNARGDFKYTLTAIRDFPNCPIRADAEKALAETERLIKMSGDK